MTSRARDGRNVVRAKPDELYVYDASRPFASRIADGLDDLWQGARMARIWAKLGWWDFKGQTRRTLLGPLWSVLGTGITVAVLGYVYGAVLDLESAQAFPYIAGGLVIWFFISGCINGGLSTYMSARGVIEERSLPISFSVYRFVFRYAVELIVKFSVFAVAAAAVALPVNANMLLAIPGVLILLVNGLWVVLVFAPLGARFRDVAQIVSPLMLIAFLASPVLWPEGMLGSSSFIAKYNPFAHFLAIVRDPLMGSAPSATSVTLTLAFAVTGWILAVVVHCMTKDRIVYWL